MDEIKKLINKVGIEDSYKQIVLEMFEKYYNSKSTLDNITKYIEEKIKELDDLIIDGEQFKDIFPNDKEIYNSHRIIYQEILEEIQKEIKE